MILEEEVVGREIEISVLGNEDPEASVAGEITPGADFYDYEDKYEDGAELLIPAPARATTSWPRSSGSRSAAYRACKVEGLARVDFFYEDGSRGPRHAGLARQRDQHDAGVHPDLDVPEDVGGRRARLPVTHRPNSWPSPSPATNATTATPAPTTEPLHTSLLTPFVKRFDQVGSRAARRNRMSSWRRASVPRRVGGRPMARWTSSSVATPTTVE